MGWQMELFKKICNFGYNNIVRKNTVYKGLPGISPAASRRSLAAGEQAPRRLRGDCGPDFLRRAQKARSDEGVAPPENEKSNPIGLLRSLSRVDKKDATLKMPKLLIYQGFSALFELFFKFFSSLYSYL
jgi:hypothetical protein